MSDKRLEEIKQFQDEIRTLSESPENQRRAACWDRHEGDDDYIWHPTPKEGDSVPFTVEFEKVGFSQLLDFSVVEFYSDPVAFVHGSLRIGIWKFKNIDDFSPIGKGITYWPGVGYEKSLFGVPQEITEEDAWVGREDAIHERVPIDSLKVINFDNDPVIVETKNFYEQMQNCLDDDFTVSFPQWCRSPWGVAWHLRGIDNLLIDVYEDPEWVEQLLNFLTENRILFTKERAQYSGKNIYPCNIYNDEVTSPIISPQTYRDLILPTEKKLSAVSGGVGYWHSCGETTIYQEYINQIPGLNLVHVSPWTDLGKAEERYNRETILEYVIHPARDVFQSDESRMTQQLETAKQIVQNHRLVVRADGFEFGNDLSRDMKQIHTWIDVANNVLMN